MNRDHLQPHPDDALLQRYREANELDTARPGPALRENVLTLARSATTVPTEARRPAAGPANDSVWAWRALGGLAVIGLAGLLMLQFDRGTPEERNSAFGTHSTRPSVVTPPPEVTATAPPTKTPSPSEQQPSKAIDASPFEQEPKLAEAKKEKPAPAVEAQAQTPRGQAKELTEELVARKSEPERPVETVTAASPIPADQASATQAAPMATAPAAVPRISSPATPAPLSRAAPVSSAKPPSPAEAAEVMGASRDSAKAAPREEQEIASPRVAPSAADLSNAIVARNTDMLQQLLAAGADPNGRGPAGRTPLMEAARSGQETMVRMLLRAQADRFLRDPDGLSAADHAERNGHLGLMPLLR